MALCPRGVGEAVADHRHGSNVSAMPGVLLHVFDRWLAVLVGKELAEVAHRLVTIAIEDHTSELVKHLGYLSWAASPTYTWV